MPELQVSSPTPSENNSPPRRLRRLSMNAARKCAIRRRSLSKSVPKDDHARDPLEEGEIYDFGCGNVQTYA